MRDESTARPAPRLKSSGPDMKASFPVHERIVNSLRVILGWFGAWRLRRRRIVRGLDHQLRSRRGAESASPFTAVRAGRIHVVVPKSTPKCLAGHSVRSLPRRAAGILNVCPLQHATRPSASRYAWRRNSSHGAAGCATCIGGVSAGRDGGGGAAVPTGTRSEGGLF